jgi:putative spermidine/putrescine transport system substrate-binding protein
MTTTYTRRRVLLTSAAGAGALFGTALLPRRAAAADEIVAATYPGSFEESYRKVLVPAFQKATKGDVVLTPILAVEQVAKITAAPNNPPIDVALLDEGPMLQASTKNIFEPFPAAKAKNDGELLPAFRSRQWGPTVTVQLCGIAYNPKKIKTPPKSWKDLWNPEYKGRVGLTTMESSLGTAFVVEVAKLHGGSEANVEPGFQPIRELLPNVGAIAPSPGALTALFQQGQIDIAPNYFNSTELLASKGVDVAFARPETGLVLIRTSMHIAKNSKAADLALQYIDTAISAPVQEKLQDAPYYLVPTNRQAKFSEAIQRVVGGGPEALEKQVINDWEEINKHRTEWIKRYSELIRK